MLFVLHVLQFAVDQGDQIKNYRKTKLFGKKAKEILKRPKKILVIDSKVNCFLRNLLHNFDEFK